MILLNNKIIFDILIYLIIFLTIILIIFKLKSIKTFNKSFGLKDFII